MMENGSAGLSKKRVAGYVAIGLVIAFMAYCVVPVLRWLTLMEIFKAQGCRMRVWVKVVDQNDNPVPGYQLHVGGWAARLIPIGEERGVGYWIATDADGLALFDSGKKVTRVFLGDAFSGEGLKNLNYLASQENLTLSCSEIDATDERQSRAKGDWRGKDRERPLIVKVFKHGPPQRLLRWDHHESAICQEDSYVSVDFLKGVMWQSEQPEGDMSWRNTSGVNEAEIVAGAGAGVQPVLDPYVVEPPQSGYMKSLQYPGDWGGKLGRGLVYFYCRNKLCYGYMHWGGTACFAIVNLDGERNLYYRGYPQTDQYNMKDFISPPVILPSKRTGSIASSR